MQVAALGHTLAASLLLTAGSAGGEDIALDDRDAAEVFGKDAPDEQATHPRPNYDGVVPSAAVTNHKSLYVSHTVWILAIRPRAGSEAAHKTIRERLRPARLSGRT